MSRCRRPPPETRSSRAKRCKCPALLPSVHPCGIRPGSTRKQIPLPPVGLAPKDSPLPEGRRLLPRRAAQQRPPEHVQSAPRPPNNPNPLAIPLQPQIPGLPWRNPPPSLSFPVRKSGPPQMRTFPRARSLPGGGGRRHRPPTPFSPARGSLPPPSALCPLPPLRGPATFPGSLHRRRPSERASGAGSALAAAPRGGGSSVAALLKAARRRCGLSSPPGRLVDRACARGAAAVPDAPGGDDQEDGSERGGAAHPGQAPLPDGHPGLVQGGQDGHRVALPHGPLRRAVHAHHRGLPPQVLQHPRRGLPAGHPGHLRQPPLPGHAPPLHPHRRRLYPRLQPGQPRLLRGGPAAEAADRGDQILPQEQDQGERGGAPGHLWQQGRPGLLPGGRAPGDRAAGGPRSQEVRLLRDLGQEEQQPGPDVPSPLRHGQTPQRDEPRPAPQGLRPVLRTPPEKGPEGQETAEGGGRRGRLRHRGPLCPPPQRAQRPHVHSREGRPGRAGERQGALRDQLRPAWGARLFLPKGGVAHPSGALGLPPPLLGGTRTPVGGGGLLVGGHPGKMRLWTGGETFRKRGNGSR